MVFCNEHSEQLGKEMRAWGMAHLAPRSREDHFRRRRAYMRGSTKPEDFDTMANTLLVLEYLLEGQYTYLGEDDEDDFSCVICELDAELLLKLAVNSTATKLRLMRGPDN